MTWDDLNIKDRAAIIRTGVKNGLKSVADIKAAYNKFDAGEETTQVQAPTGLNSDVSWKWDNNATDEEASVYGELNMPVVTPNGVYYEPKSSYFNSQMANEAVKDRQQKAIEYQQHLERQQNELNQVSKAIGIGMYAPTVASNPIVGNTIADIVFHPVKNIMGMVGAHYGSKATDAVVRNTTNYKSWDDMFKNTAFEGASSWVNPGALLGGIAGDRAGNYMENVGRNIYDFKNHIFAAKTPYGYEFEDFFKRFSKSILSGKPANVESPWWEYGDKARTSAHLYLNTAERPLTEENIKHQMHARSDIWRMRWGLPQKFNTFVENPMEAGTITDPKGIQGLQSLAIDPKGNNFDIVNGVGANTGKIQMTDVGKDIANDELGVMTMKDVWDIHPFRRNRDRINERLQTLFNNSFFAKPAGISYKYVDSKLGNLYNLLKYDNKAINNYLKENSDAYNEFFDPDMFATENKVSSQLGDWVGALRQKLPHPLSFIKNNKPLQKLSNKAKDWEVVEMLGGKPAPTVRYDIPYTKLSRLDLDEWGNPVVREGYLKGFPRNRLIDTKAANFKKQYPFLDYKINLINKKAYGGNLFFPGGFTQTPNAFQQALIQQPHLIRDDANKMVLRSDVYKSNASYGDLRFVEGSRPYEERMKRNAQELNQKLQTIRREQHSRNSGGKGRGGRSNPLFTTSGISQRDSNLMDNFVQSIDNVSKGMEEFGKGLAIENMAKQRQEDMRKEDRLKAEIGIALTLAPYVFKGAGAAINSNAYRDAALSSGLSRYVPHQVTDGMIALRNPAVAKYLNKKIPAGLNTLSRTRCLGSDATQASGNIFVPAIIKDLKNFYGSYDPDYKKEVADEYRKQLRSHYGLKEE